MAARSLLQLFRAVNPTLLARKDRVCCLKPVWVRSCLLMALLLRVGADADSCARVATRREKRHRRTRTRGLPSTVARVWPSLCPARRCWP